MAPPSVGLGRCDGGAASSVAVVGCLSFWGRLTGSGGIKTRSKKTKKKKKKMKIRKNEQEVAEQKTKGKRNERQRKEEGR